MIPLDEIKRIDIVEPNKYLRVYFGKNIIRPYQEISPNIQKKVVELLQKEWGNRYTDAFIVMHWNIESANIMYVICGEDACLGTIAVDIRKGIPFISTLFVVPEYRKKGYGGLLQSTAEYHFKIHGYTYIKLWCTHDKVVYYKTYGWTFDHVIQSYMFLMSKPVLASDFASNFATNVIENVITYTKKTQDAACSQSNISVVIVT